MSLVNGAGRVTRNVYWIVCEYKVHKTQYYGGARVGAASVLFCAVLHGFVRLTRRPLLTGG